MKPPTRKLIGGVRESHTKEYLFQISGQTSGCRGRLKFRAQEQQEHETRARTRFFGEKERESGRRDASQGCPWAPGGCVARPGAGSRHLASWARGGLPWSASGVPRWRFTWKF